MTKPKAAHPTLDQNRMIVLPLKPRFAEAILAGSKTVDLRRSEPKIVVPTRALIYATSPLRALVGTCIVATVKSDRLAALWREFGSRTGVDHREFLRYFQGVETGTALTLSDADSLPRPVSLTRLREASQGFRPPQSFAYIDTRTGDGLLRTAA